MNIERWFSGLLALAAIGLLTPVNRKTAYVICGSLAAMIAVSRPIPRPPPVTNTTLPSSIPM